ncbi:hypothetical protein [Petroclostridium sp. X23]|uniref:hypothetical protein n=1 Tax=Petroclostridium sp. X23 TaxID=3045146 RepID=UPI0024AE503F|nr:hypothetical protein [Petroclostridium sp. X23]WHH60966.1 hypothetical protein QKW49_09775 [Petroclostridium sp. X23]
MKRLVSYFMILSIVLGLVGCGAKETAKTEEELRAKVKAELEAEEAMKEKFKEEMREELKKELNNGASEKAIKKSVSIDDKDAIFEFLKQKLDIQQYIPEYRIEMGYTFNRENFDKWLCEYFDFTGDGNNDVVYFNTYFDGGLGKAIFISADSGKYEIVPSDVDLAKYDNGFFYEDGFIMLRQKSGGSGMGDIYQCIFVYDGKIIKNTGGSLQLESYFAGPKGYGNSKGKITEKINGYKEFIFEIHSEEGSNESDQVTTSVKRTKYTYDEKTLTYKELNLSDSDKETVNKEINKESANSIPDVHLEGFENETLYSEDSPSTIDYSKYSLVIVPMQESKNLDKLMPKVVEVTETGKEGRLNFSVFGTLYNVNLTYTKNALDNSEESKEIFIGDKIENQCVFVNVELPTDFSSVVVTGSYQSRSGMEGIEFSLDDMRDLKSYKILTVDAYSFPDEDY